MSVKNTMARLPGLLQRNGVWYLRTMIPLSLQEAYGGRCKIVETLQTSDSTVAKVKGTARRAEHLADFEQRKRELNPQRIERVSAEMGKLLAARVAAQVL